MVFLFIFFACPKKTNQKKRPFFLGILPYQANHNKAPKFFPRLQKFLTEPYCYTERKECQSRSSLLLFCKNAQTGILFTSVVKQRNAAALGSGALHPTSATRGMHKRGGLPSAG